MALLEAQPTHSSQGYGNCASGRWARDGFPYKGQESNPQEIGRLLKVGAVLTGGFNSKGVA